MFETKRTAKRIRIEVPVHLDPGSGVTRDVSPSGVYFFSDRIFTPGMSLCFSLELDYAFPGEPMHLCCRGKVLRVEEVGGKTGVAASICDFRSAA
ncbi:MAG TPA: PilZ domain-containing protein [Geopsychrobacteraceae bacterium]